MKLALMAAPLFGVVFADRLAALVRHGDGIAKHRKSAQGWSSPVMNLGLFVSALFGMAESAAAAMRNG
jgi:hypothetical protein